MSYEILETRGAYRSGRLQCSIATTAPYLLSELQWLAHSWPIVRTPQKIRRDIRLQAIRTEKKIMLQFKGQTLWEAVQYRTGVFSASFEIIYVPSCVQIWVHPSGTLSSVIESDASHLRESFESTESREQCQGSRATNNCTQRSSWGNKNYKCLPSIVELIVHVMQGAAQQGD